MKAWGKKTVVGNEEIIELDLNKKWPNEPKSWGFIEDIDDIYKRKDLSDDSWE